MRVVRAPFRFVSAIAPLCLLAAGLLSSCHHPASPPAAMRPINLVLVTVDTLRADHLRCYGYQSVETPAIDAVARNGVLFENAVTQTPLTPPSHASIFTGLYPTSHHVRNTGGFVLQASSVTLARILQQHGWHTAAFVSSAVLKKHFGFDQGFSVYDDQMPKPGDSRDTLADPERPAGQTVDRAIQWLAGQSGGPFFLWVHVYDPHMPYRPPSPYREKYKSNPYDGEIAYTDHELRRLFDAVKAKGTAGDTLVAVLSDHGESLGEHGEYSHGVFLYDATLRIPFILAGPGVPAGLRVRRQARTIDFLPTVLDLMGAQPPTGIQGVSLKPFFKKGGNAATEFSYGETLYPKINMGWADLRAIRTERWKYIRAPRQELYDLSRDPLETNNLAASNPAEVQKLKGELKKVVGAEGAEKVESTSVDRRTMEQLKSLGYVGGFSPRSIQATGQGIDPKDRTQILKLIKLAEDPDAPTPLLRRIQYLEEALRQDASNPDLYYELGGKYEKARRFPEAIQLYRAALGKGIESSRLHSRIADLLVRSGKKAEAIPEYETAGKLDPADAESQSNLATAYLELGRIADAERVLKAVITTDPDYAPAYNGLGLISIQKRDGASARDYFERAVHLDPDQIEAQLNLGLLYRMAGDRSRARSCFEAFLAKASPQQYGEVIPKVRDALVALQ